MRPWLDHVRSRVVAAVLLCAACGAAYADAAPSDRAPTQMAATLTAMSTTQAGGTFALNARLAPNDNVLRTPVHEGGAFKMTGTLASAPTVCYADTIFRDDFDGDGF